MKPLANGLGYAWFLVADRAGGTERTWHAWLHPDQMTNEQAMRTPAAPALCGFVNGAPLTAFNATFDPHIVCSDQRCARCGAASSGIPFTPYSNSKPEAINHPSHYGGDTTYETIKVIEAWDLDFNIGNAVKYLSRAGKKDPAKTIEDLQKAIWYVERAISRLEKKP